MTIVRLDPELASRSREVAPTGIVIHATAGSTARSSIDYLRKEGLSYHYIVARDGRNSASARTSDGTPPVVFHCVAHPRHAFHVGSNVPVPGASGSINKNSIGISLANIQKSGANFEPYAEAQLKAFDELIGRIMRDVPSIRWITRHADVQPWNRGDPAKIDCAGYARKYGLTYWVPEKALIAAHTPQRTRIA